MGQQAAATPMAAPAPTAALERRAVILQLLALATRAAAAWGFLAGRLSTHHLLARHARQL